MRDAGVYVREHNWEEAYSLWKKVYDTKKGNHKMRAAFNLALYSEIQGDFDQAKAYIEEKKWGVKEASLEFKDIDPYKVEAGDVPEAEAKPKKRGRKPKNAA